MTGSTTHSTRFSAYDTTVEVSAYLDPDTNGWDVEWFEKDLTDPACPG